MINNEHYRKNKMSSAIKNVPRKKFEEELTGLIVSILFSVHYGSRIFIIDCRWAGPFCNLTLCKYFIHIILALITQSTKCEGLWCIFIFIFFNVFNFATAATCHCMLICNSIPPNEKALYGPSYSSSDCHTIGLLQMQ